MSTTPSPTTRPPEYVNNVLTTWIPLTTTFTPAAGCETLMMKWFGDLVAWDPGYGIFVETESTKCHAQQVTDWWDVDHLSPNVNLASTAYSLGPVVCPSPYTSAASAVNPLSSTIVACCPSPYTYVSMGNRPDVGQCRSRVTGGQVFTYMQRYDIVPPTSSGVTTTVTTPYPTTWKRTVSTVPTTGTQYVYAIQVNGWVFPTTDASAGNQTNNGGGNNGTDAAGNGNDNSSGSGGMSNGAKIGLGVGLGIAGAAAIAALAFFLLRRKRKAETPMTPKQAMPDDGHSNVQSQPLAGGYTYGSEPKKYDEPLPPPTEMYSGGGHPEQQPYQQQYQPQHQQPVQYHEMPSNQNRAELA